VSSKVPGSAEKKRPPGGSRKGCPNKNTKALKDMILGALAAGGGQAWLQEQMERNPSAFMQLLGKVLPSEMKVSNPDGTPLFSPEQADAILEAARRGPGRA
jgi:hypothetical protein